MMINELSIIPISSIAPEKRRIYGYTIIKATGAPTKKRVLVYNRGSDGIALGYVASTISDATTGFWEIRGLPTMPENNLVVTAFDDSKAYNCESFDFQSLVV